MLLCLYLYCQYQKDVVISKTIVELETFRKVLTDLMPSLLQFTLFHWVLVTFYLFIFYICGEKEVQGKNTCQFLIL